MADSQTQSPLLDRATRIIKRNPGIVLTVGYAAATLIGMVSSHALLDRFGINVFDYAEAGDFLVAAIRSPMGSLSVLLGGAVTWLALGMDRWMRNRWRRYDRIYRVRWMERATYHPVALAAYFAVYAWGGSLIYAKRMEATLRAGETRRVAVQLQDSSEPMDAVLLYTTRSYVFFLDPATDVVSVVPIENLARITVRDSA